MIDRKNLLRKVQALLDKADSTQFTAEAEAFRTKADKMMLTYAIEEFELAQSKPSTSRPKPGNTKIHTADRESPFQTALVDLISAIAQHARCKIVFYGLRGPKKTITAHLVGYPADLEYAELLFTSLRIQMAHEMEPKPRPEVSEEQNIVTLKEAGLKAERIAELLGWDNPDSYSSKRKIGDAYRAFCQRTGHVSNVVNPVTYQRNFAEGYASKVSWRLWKMQEANQGAAAGKELVLVAREQEVQDIYDEIFPNVRHVSTLAKRTYDSVARGNGSNAGERADLSGGRNIISSRKALK